MCFILDDNDKAAPRVAKEDLVVFKYLLNSYKGKNILKSPYRDFLYDFNKQKSWYQKFSDTELKKLKFDKCLNIGLHSYTYKNVPIELYSIWAVCIIPKGTKYFVNKNTGEAISEKIIYLGRLNKRPYNLSQFLKELRKLTKYKYKLELC